MFALSKRYFSPTSNLVTSNQYVKSTFLMQITP